MASTGQLTATVSPTNASNKKITWTSSNTNSATVDSNGKVTAKGAGNATITATSQADGSKKATCAVTVTKASKRITAIRISAPNLGVDGPEFVATAILTPSDATEYNLVWETDGRSMINKTGPLTAVCSLVSSQHDYPYVEVKDTYTGLSYRIDA